MRFRVSAQFLKENDVEPALAWQSTSGLNCTQPSGGALIPEVDFKWPWRYDFRHICAALQDLKGRDVLFMSTFFGSDLQMSYALRARQVARGLRRFLGVEARACVTSCRACCDRLELCDDRARGRCRVPAAIVHIKGICECATAIFPKSRGVVHMLDPVDRYLSPPPLHLGSRKSAPYREVSALLAETSTAALEYHSHPSVVEFGWQVFHLPHHHSNLARRTATCRKEADVIGVHSSKLDPELKQGVEKLLSERFPHVKMHHVQPQPMEWRVRAGLSPFGPGFSEPILSELREFDMTLMKPNCYDPRPEEQGSSLLDWRAWLCERHHSGQRLVHALSVGVPAVVWGGATGHVDALRPSSDWPLAWSNEEMVEQLAALLSNRTLRCSLAAQAPILAEPYHLERNVERYALALAEMVRRVRPST
mmetsp:Transcript_179948/g.570963  ORF Transcript_179948/g.570963 Transcript_179948/m.570963 type:complete len:422 (-) Transcript_179948:65-1330(-)